MAEADEQSTTFSDLHH